MKVTENILLNDRAYRLESKLYLMKNTTTNNINKRVAKNHIFTSTVRTNVINGRSVKRPRGIKVHVQGYAGQHIIHFIIFMKRHIKLIPPRDGNAFSTYNLIINNTVT